MDPVTAGRAGSRELFERARRSIPGGVNSPVRAFQAVGTHPRFLQRGSGSTVWDVEGWSYIDLVGSWGPLLLGHAHPEVVEAIIRTAADGTSFGAPTQREIELAEEIIAAVPSVEAVRLVSSGTEATMSAVRLARGATGRDLLVKFEGCYHGHGDSFLIQAGSGAATFGHPSSPGVTAGTARDTLSLPYNDLAAVEAAFESCPGRIAAIIVEPVAANMGCVLPGEGFLEGLRRICDRDGALLIFDEVITGFRLSLGGAQERFGVRPDLTTLGKVIGGGLPVGAYGGSRDRMRHLAPEGPVYQAGTLSGNPLAVAAGLTTLRILRRDRPYARLEQLGCRLRDGLAHRIDALGLPASVTGIGSLACLYFRDPSPRDWSEAAGSDTARFAVYFREMLARGIYTAPSQFEAIFLGVAHDERQIEQILDAAGAALQAAAEAGR